MIVHQVLIGQLILLTLLMPFKMVFKVLLMKGRTPTSEELLSFATSVGLRNRWGRDDDDLIGVRANAYPNFGARVDEEVHRETTQGLSNGYYLTYMQGGRFTGEDAIWNFTTWPVVITGDPRESSEEYNTQERAGWWLFAPIDM